MFTTGRLELGRSFRIESREADADWKVMIMRFFMRNIRAWVCADDLKDRYMKKLTTLQV